MAALPSRRGVLTGIAALAVAPAVAHAQVTPVSQINIPMSDARAIGPNSVRFVAAQETGKAPSVALFGVKKECWPTIRTGLQQAVADGFPIRAVFMGPIDAPPSMEIYAKGHHVTNPINPNTITQSDLTKLIRDVYREYYPTRLAAAPSPGR